MLTEFDNRRKHKLSSVITINLKKKVDKATDIDVRDKTCIMRNRK